MKALLLTRPYTATPIDLTTVETPAPGPGQVLVRVHAISINHRDGGFYNESRTAPPEFKPFIPGTDAAGVVAAVGEGVTTWQEGDAVIMNSVIACGTCEYCLRGEQNLCPSSALIGNRRMNGTFAQYVLFPAVNLAPKPAHLDFAQAAALPMALATAWRSVMTKAALRPGQSVLIHGIGSGVALFSLQLAVAMGARAIVTSSSDEKLAQAMAMGAWAGLNYKQEDVAQRVAELTEGRGVDAVLDSTGAQTIPVSIKAVRRGGRVVVIGGTTGWEAKVDILEILFKEVQLLGLSMSTAAEFTEAVRFVADRRLEPVISAVLPWTEYDAAFRAMNDGAQFGKLVLTVD